MQFILRRTLALSNLLTIFILNRYNVAFKATYYIPRGVVTFSTETGSQMGTTSSPFSRCLIEPFRSKRQEYPFRRKPSDIKKTLIRLESSGCIPKGVMTEFSTRGFSVICSNDWAKTGPWEVTIFVWVLGSVQHRPEQLFLSRIILAEIKKGLYKIKFT